MAETLALARSIIAVVQLADRIAAVCKFFIESTQDYPRELRLIYVETNSLKVIFEGLSFLDQGNPADWTKLKALQGDNGLLERCKDAVTELDKLFPSLPLSTASKRKRGKKETLQMVLASLAWPLKADKAKKLMDEIMRYKSTIGVALQGQLLTDVQHLGHRLDEISAAMSASEKQKVVDWFWGTMPQGTNPHALHNSAKELYEDKTGDWIFETPEWDKWINCRERALWIHGIPGAGKTVLASHVIEKTLSICETRGKKTRCSYYYCHHSHNRDETPSFLGWLISQLLQGLDKFPDVALEVYTRRGLPDSTHLLAVLAAVLPSFDRVYVGIDALDESQPRARLLQLLERFTTEPRFAKIQLFATSREYEDIRRKMTKMAQPLSMSNPFVEADIRLYVAAKIAENPRFRCWPGDLRSEVEGALSTGAKGMFRWAVCQLDILRRLHQQSKIREAIRSLPETLDETYERIFSYIPEEEQGLVRLALHLTCFHDTLWKGEMPLPGQVLLDLYATREKTVNQSSLGDSLLDLETLKDICGCLISFSAMHGGEAVNVAHYTVREFLESSRASGSLTASMKLGHEDRCAILASIFEYAIAWLEEDERNYNEDDGRPFMIFPASSSGKYCLASSAWSFVKCEALVQPSLAFKLLNPYGAHYGSFQGTLKRQERTMPRWFPSGRFWAISWAGGCKSTKGCILISLLTMKCFALAKVYLDGLDMKRLMRELLNGEVMRFRGRRGSGPPELEHEAVQVEGNLVSLLCQLRLLNKDTLSFIRQEASGLIDYSNLLSSYMLGHDYCRFAHNDDGVLEQLLQHGADPNPKGSQVMPLQISAYKKDLTGLTSLLEQGADPHNIGDPQGGVPSPRFPLTLSGLPLVDILSQFPPDYHVSRSDKAIWDKAVSKLETLLGVHGLSLPKGWGTTS